MNNEFNVHSRVLSTSRNKIVSEGSRQVSRQTCKQTDNKVIHFKRRRHLHLTFG